MSDKIKLVVDTSVFMEDVETVRYLIENYNVIVPYTVLAELDNHKSKRDNNLSYRARHAIRLIEDNYSKFIFCDSSIGIDFKNDDRILQCAIDNKAAIATYDICLKVKSRSVNVDVVELDFDYSSIERYTGYFEAFTDNEEDNEKLSEIYNDKYANPFGLYINQYLIVKDRNGKILDKMRYTKDGFFNFNIKSIDSMALGKIKPLDEYQSCLMDSLTNNQMTMVTGKAGSGKSLISLAYAMSMIEKGKYSKLIVFTNPVNTRNSARLGFYKGSRIEKLLESFVGGMLSSKLGGIEGVNYLLDTGKLEILPFSDIRGYDTNGMNAIIWILESQNLDIDLLKLGIQRIGSDCKLIIDGDDMAQVDMQEYENGNNGMKRASDVFRGEEIYGEVQLKNIYRSKLAEIADKM